MAKILFPALALSVLLLGLPGQAQASHRSELAEAAACYRKASLHFGHEVIAQPGLTAFEKRLAPELVRISGHLEVLARYPHHLDRLRETWWEVEQLHRRVESVLLSHPGCPVYVALRPCWDEVLCAYRDLSRELAAIGCHLGHNHGHHHGHHSGHVTQLPAAIHVRPRYQVQPPQVPQASYRYRNEPVRSYRYGNLGRSVTEPSSSQRSPSEEQLHEVESHVQRERGRQSVDAGQIGAILSRRMTRGF